VGLQQDDQARSYDPARDAYQILGLGPDAPAELVEPAFMRTALVWHPERCDDPDAAARLAEAEEAARLLVDPAARARYDRERTAHRGEARRQALREGWRAVPAGPGDPLGPPPPWLAARVRCHFDSVFLTLFVRRRLSPWRLLTGVGAVASIVACVLFEQSLLAILLGMVWFAIAAAGLVPSGGRPAWARLVPGRGFAESFRPERGRKGQRREAVAWDALGVDVVASESAYRVVLAGLPGGNAPVLHSTRDLAEAQRFAAQAAAWLQMEARSGAARPAEPEAAERAR